MAERKQKDKLQQTIECSVCIQLYDGTSRKPRMMSCGHTYCEECLAKLYNKPDIRCPTCRKRETRRNMRNLPLNYSIISLIDVICQECNEYANCLSECSYCDLKL